MDLPKNLKLSAIYVAIVMAGVLRHSPLWATQDQLYGLGGRTTARVGSVTAETQNPFAALYNPALLATTEGRQMAVSTSIAGARYGGFGVVRVDSPEFRTANGVNRDEAAKLPDFSTTLWAVGYRHGFTLPFWDNRLAGVGVVFSGPMSSLRKFSSPSPYDFTTLRYGAADTQFKGSGSVGLEILPNVLAIGAGASVFISSSGVADTVIAAENPTARMKMDVAMNSSWLVGAFFRQDAYSAAFTYRQRIRPQFAQQLEGQVDFAGTRVFNQPMQIESTLYFEPHVFELEAQAKYSGFTVSAGLSYQLWSQHQPAYMRVAAKARDGTTRTTRAPAIPFRDTWVPRISVEVPLDENTWTLTGGYLYRPTPVVDLSGIGNLLDTNAHVLGIGVGVRLGQGILGTEEMRLNLSGQWHLLEKREIRKVDPGLIGAPGYDFKGNAYVLGLAAEMTI